MTPAEALDKIKKLLRMQRGGTQAEIETALALAAELARKHGIDLAGVDPDHEPDQPISHIDATTAARIGWECKYAALVCQSFFNVTALIRQKRTERSLHHILLSYRYGRRCAHTWYVTFVGTGWDTQIAQYVYHFIASHMRRCWNRKPLSWRGARLRNRQAYLHGMYLGICHKLNEQKKSQVNGAGLIFLGRAVQRRADYMKNTFGEIGDLNTTPDSDAHAAKEAGIRAGLDTEIRSGLTNKGQATPLLT